MFLPVYWSQYNSVLAESAALTTNSAEGYNSAFAGNVLYSVMYCVAM